MLATPTAGRPVLWKPHAGPQTRFLASTAREVLYGGQAGGGKSAALIGAPLRWVQHRDFRALILRRKTTDLGNLLDKAQSLYPRAVPKARGVQDGASVTWHFPSGAQIWFTHCQHEKDAARFDGDEFQFVGFDELTHFTELQYVRILARIRTPNTALPTYVRSTTNPGGEGHNWVFRRFAPWLWREPGTAEIPRWDSPRAASGEVLHYVPEADGSERWVPRGTPGALSRTFIRSTLADNPSLAKTDYATTLAGLDPLRRAQLRDGDWLAHAAAGTLFKRGWFRVVDAVPAEGVLARWRAWDRAATEPHEGNRDPDWTVGVKIARVGKLFFVEDVVRERARPMAIEKLMLTTAHLDGRDTSIHVFRDPGSAGVAEEERILSLLAGFDVHSQPNTGDKVSRARPFSAQVEAGNVMLVRGRWNEEFVREHEAFPEGGHDDQVDAAAAAFSRVAPTSDLEFALAMCSV